MLYSILPPILVILSLVGIIVFLVKKFSKIKKACQEEDIATMKKNDFNGEIPAEKSSEKGKWKKAENVFLIILEKMARRLRTFSLKLEVWFSGLSGKIRSRRNGTGLASAEDDAKEQSEDKILEKLNSFKPKNISEVKPAGREKSSLPRDKEKVTEPMISKKITMPQTTSTGVKNKLEDLLIERVAANPKDIEAYERLGEYYMEIETYNDAKECFKQVMKLCPTNRNVKYKIKRLERLLGE